MARILLEKGADPNPADHRYSVSLLAAANGSIGSDARKIVELLEQHGARADDLTEWDRKTIEQNRQMGNN